LKFLIIDCLLPKLIPSCTKEDKKTLALKIKSNTLHRAMQIGLVLQPIVPKFRQGMKHQIA
jgi:hypothetical protein